MNTRPPSAPRRAETGDSRWPTYVAVLLVEAAMIAGLWAFGLYFSG